MHTIWHDLFAMGIPVTEKAVRTAAVYLLIVVLLRLAGKRDMAGLNSLDLCVMLLLSNVVQNAVIGPDNSLVGGVLGAVILVGLNAALAQLVSRSGALSRLTEGTPTTLAADGKWNVRALRREALRRDDVDAALRRQNANDVSELQSLILQPGGAVVATVKPELQQATKSDIARLEAAIGQLADAVAGRG
jgi:uncharacterized membrane protein YcaP (DUF421 family)